MVLKITPGESYDLVVIKVTDPVFGMQLGFRPFRVHPYKNCTGRNCVIHCPSDHPLWDAPMTWRADRGIMERECSHGIGHYDPDDLAYRRVTGNEQDGECGTSNSCDGCCRKRAETDEEAVDG